MTEGADPTAIGPFVVLRKLGEGAMGVVYAGFDVGLDRKVALKLIRRKLVNDAEMRARMFREAQAMARLSHPNVVRVFQVSEHDGEIYLAMEYVEGQTLSSWLSAGPRTWKTVLRTVVAAGRGLAAAHAAGLVHRDFKPDNVLVDAAGDARVVDFGLVHTLGPEDARGTGDMQTSGIRSSPTISRSTSMAISGVHSRISTLPFGNDGEFGSVRLTQAGKSLGTPAYMSPEQHFGDPVGPASDQFSFSITLYEALYGTRPFSGGTWGEIKRKVQRGQIPPPPRDSRVPRRIFKILARGLAPTPDLRWQNLDAMLDALEYDPRRVALRVAGIVALASAAAAGSYVVARAQYGAARHCQASTEALAEVWNEARAQAGERAFAATGTPFGDEAWHRVKTRLDGYAQAWTTESTRACEAHATGSQSARLFDRRTLCLAQRRAHFSALIDVLTTADRAVVENAVQATAALPSIDSCADEEALLAVAPPEDAKTAAQVEVLREQLARAAALEATGQYPQGLKLAEEVRTTAESLRYPPLDAEAALCAGSLLMAVMRADAAEPALMQALRTALEHGLDGVAAEAAAKRIFVVGELLGHRVVALDGAPVAEALAARARDDGRIAALLHNNLGVVHAGDGDHERARTHYLQTIELLGRRAGPPDPLIAIVHHNLGGLLREQGKLVEARDHYTQAVALFSDLLGEHHPLLAHPISGTADVDVREGRFADASDRYIQALVLMEASYGPDHHYLIDPLVGLAHARVGVGGFVEATGYLRRAVAIGERRGIVYPIFAEALEGLAERLAADDPPEARRLLARAIAVHEVTGPASPAIAAPALRAGQLAAAAGDVEAARASFERVLSVTTGRKDQVDIRTDAALALARRLAATGEQGGRACTLATEAVKVLASDDPRRADADAVRTAVCGPRSPP